MITKDRNLRLALLLVTFVSILIVGFLYNRSLDLGFAKVILINDVIAYLTLVSAIFGGVFAYKILLTTLDQRDISFMPFLSVIGLNPSDSGLEVNFRNNGLGPAVEVYWKLISSNLSFSEGRPRQEVILPGTSTSVSRPWAAKLNCDVNDLELAMTCKDQVGNKYDFVCIVQKDLIEFVRAQKNGKPLV